MPVLPAATAMRPKRQQRILQQRPQLLVGSSGARMLRMLWLGIGTCLLSSVLRAQEVHAQSDSDGTVRQYFRFGGTMDLSPIAESAVLSPAAIAEWEQRTSDFYMDALNDRNDLIPPISDPEVTINLLFAARPGDDTTGAVLAMQYRASASFVTSSTADYDPGFLALPAFRDQDAVLQYVVGLRQSGHDIYDNLSSLSLRVQGATPVDAPTEAPTRTPTPEPTPAPTTPGPTSFPTQAPVVVLQPTFSLTAAPVVTEAPVAAAETPSPTTLPPSPAPTPTTPSPTEEPVEEVVTEAPSSATTEAVTTMAPVAAEVLEVQTKYATTSLVFNTLPGVMEGQVLEDWKNMTVTYIRDYIQTLASDLLASNANADEDDWAIEKVVQDVLYVVEAEEGDDNGEEDGQDAADNSAGVVPVEERQGTRKKKNRLQRQRQRQRYLQDEEAFDNDNATTTSMATTTVSLSVEFVSRLALPARYDATSLVNGAFSTRSRRQIYREYIMEAFRSNDDGTEASTLSFFEPYLMEVLYVSDSTGDTIDPDDGEGGDGDETDSVNEGDNMNNGNDDGGGGGGDDSSMAGIIGGVVGGLVLALILVMILYKRNVHDKKNKNIRKKDSTSSDGGVGSAGNGTRNWSPTTGGGSNGGVAGSSGIMMAAALPPGAAAALQTPNRSKGGISGLGTGLTWEPAEQPSRLNQEIEVPSAGSGDDVSTIGDPYMYGNKHDIMEEDERTATTSVLQTETYNSLLGRPRMQHENSFGKSTADQTEFSAFTGMSKYLGGNNGNNTNNGTGMYPPRSNGGGGGLLGELGLGDDHDNDDTSFEQRLFPMDAMAEERSNEREHSSSSHGQRQQQQQHQLQQQQQQQQRRMLEDDDDHEENQEEQLTVEGEERSLDYSLPTALM